MQVTGASWIDPATALVVAAAIVVAGVRILSRTSRVLVDEALPPEELEAVRHAIEAHSFRGGEKQPDGRVTVSGGVAVFPDDTDDAQILVEAADRNLYRAKEGGRNRVVSEPA